MIKAIIKIVLLPFVKLYRWLMYMERKSVLKQQAKDIFKDPKRKQMFMNELNRASREKLTAKRRKKFKKAPSIH